MFEIATSLNQYFETAYVGPGGVIEEHWPRPFRAFERSRQVAENEEISQDDLCLNKRSHTFMNSSPSSESMIIDHYT